MKNRFFSPIIAVLLLFLSNQTEVQAQALDYQNVITIVLDDGTPVVLYGEISEDRMTHYDSLAFTIDREDLFGEEEEDRPNNQDQSADDDDADDSDDDDADEETSAERIRRQAKEKEKKEKEEKERRQAEVDKNKNFKGLSFTSKLPEIKHTDDYYFSKRYFYLPTNLRLSKRPDGVPEFLFMKYTTDMAVNDGGLQGALMHFLMEWGLTPRQVTELQDKLEKKFEDQLNDYPKFKAGENPSVVGPVKLSPSDDQSFKIISATLSDKTLAPTVVTSGKSPNLPGQKIAAAARLDKYGAQLLAATFEKNRSITDVSVECSFRYKVMIPAVKGMIVINWDNLKMDYLDKFSSKDLTPGEGSLGRHDENKDFIDITDTEALFSVLLKQKVIDIQMSNYNSDDPIAKEISQIFMESFLGSISGSNLEPEEAETDIDDRIDAPDEKNYIVDVAKLKVKMARGKEIIKLNYRSTIVEEVSVLGNLGSWYDGVRNNKKCVSQVNLNDPFFQIRNINFILDVEAEELFGSEVNYVTVHVRKRRRNGHDFEDHITIDRNYLKNHGTLASVSYARGDDNSRDTYEYAIQCSMRGGHVYPTKPIWKKGYWEGVNLSVPVKPRVIEFEGDLDEMKKSSITRATLQVRYYKYGKEFESNIPITASKGIPISEKLICTDREQSGYAYRLVYNHKKYGKLATDWEPKYNDNYVYAAIPKKLIDNEKSFIDKLLEKGKEAPSSMKDRGINSSDSILDKILNGTRTIIDGLGKSK